MNLPPNTKLPSVSVVIPVFNKAELTLQCLRALRDSDEVPFEIIVVDNGSTDSTQHDIQGSTEFLDIKYIRNEVNANFSGACNQGAAEATGDIIVFLNNDTIPFKDWLSPLVKELLNPEVAVVGSKLIFPDNTIQHAGVAFMRETRFPYHPYSRMSADMPEVNHRRELQVVTGACLAIRKKDFFQFGQFNPEYKNGGEDIELCLKARHAGRKVVYQPASVLIHLESQSPGRLDNNDTNVKVFFKNFPDWLLSDEDAFYYEDGLRRMRRRDVAQIELKKLDGDEDFRRYKNLADLQLSFAGGKFGSPHLIAADVKDMPLDPDVLEWLGLVAFKGGFYKAAATYFQEMLVLKKLESRSKALEIINTDVFLNPQFNKYFAQ